MEIPPDIPMIFMLIYAYGWALLSPYFCVPCPWQFSHPTHARWPRAWKYEGTRQWWPFSTWVTRIASTVPWLTLAMEWWDGFRLIAGEALIWWLIAYGCLYVFLMLFGGRWTNQAMVGCWMLIHETKLPSRCFMVVKQPLGCGPDRIR